MECTAHGPVGAEFEVAWFSSRSDTPLQLGAADDVVLVRDQPNSSIRFQIREDETRKTIRSRLQIQLLRDPPAVGTAFWCSVTPPPDDAASGSSVTLVPSMVFILHGADTYQNLPSCGDTPQSFHGEKCATVRSALQPATPLAAMPTTTQLVPTTTTTTTTSVIETTPSNSLVWQELSPSSQLLAPTASVLSDPPPLEEGSGNMNAIVVPILACVTGVIGTLFLTSCIYLQCYYRRRKSRKLFLITVLCQQHNCILVCRKKVF